MILIQCLIFWRHFWESFKALFSGSTIPPHLPQDSRVHLGPLLSRVRAVCADTRSGSENVYNTEKALQERCDKCHSSASQTHLNRGKITAISNCKAPIASLAASFAEKSPNNCGIEMATFPWRRKSQQFHSALSSVFRALRRCHLGWWCWPASKQFESHSEGAFPCSHLRRLSFNLFPWILLGAYDLLKNQASR